LPFWRHGAHGGREAHGGEKPMTWKMENGQLAMQDGNPIWVQEVDGKSEETPIDGGRALAKITELNGEAANHRRKARELADQLKAFEGLDAEQARTALSKLADLERKGMIEAGKVDEVRAQLKAEFQVALDKANQEKQGLLASVVADRKFKIFAGSPLFASADGKTDPITFLPPEAAMKVFGDHFDFSDPDHPVAKWPDGKPILSKKNPGENADPLEALELIYAADPKRESYTRGSGMSGSGAPGNHQHGSPASYDPEAPLSQRVDALRRGVAPAA
jgi:hypothetical protein